MTADEQDPRPKHNPGEPEFGAHAGEAEHNPGEFEFDEGDAEEAASADADYVASDPSDPGLEEDEDPFDPPELGPADRA